MKMVEKTIPVCVVLILCLATSVFGVYISNLSGKCYRCMCHVAGCDTARGCAGGYCGPFYISRLYWIDAGRPVLPEDEPDRNEAFEDCARDYYCSLRIIEGYMARFGKDCNGDGVTDCLDYVLINAVGAACGAVRDSPAARQRLQRYMECGLDRQ